MKITLEIDTKEQLPAGLRIALGMLLQIKADTAAAVAASPAVPSAETAQRLGIPIAAADNPATGQVPVPATVAGVPVVANPAVPHGVVVVDTAKLFGGQQPAAASGQAPSVPAIPPIPGQSAPEASANASATVPVPASPQGSAVPAAVPAHPAGGSPAAAPPAPTNALDKEGLPWDGRIHSSTKAQNADGTWRQKRGVDQGTIDSIKQQLRALVAIPAVPAAIPAAVPAVPSTPGDATGVAVAGAAAAQAAITHADLMRAAVAWTTAVPPRITMQQIGGVLAMFGVAMLPDLQHRPDLVPAVYAAIEQQLSAVA